MCGRPVQWPLSLPLSPQLQQQQTRLMKINHDLRHRITVVEAQGKSLIEQKVELEAELQTREQEMGSLRAELGKLRERLPRGHSENGEEEPEVSGKRPRQPGGRGRAGGRLGAVSRLVFPIALKEGNRRPEDRRPGGDELGPEPSVLSFPAQGVELRPFIRSFPRSNNRRL